MVVQYGVKQWQLYMTNHEKKVKQLKTKANHER